MFGRPVTCTHIGTEQSYPVHPVCCGSPFGFRNSGLPPPSLPSTKSLSHCAHWHTSGATQVPPLLHSCFYHSRACEVMGCCCLRWWWWRWWGGWGWQDKGVERKTRSQRDWVQSCSFQWREHVHVRQSKAEQGRAENYRGTQSTRLAMAPMEVKQNREPMGKKEPATIMLGSCVPLPPGLVGPSYPSRRYLVEFVGWLTIRR